MGFQHIIRDAIYNVIVKYQVLLYLLPALKPIMKLLMNPHRRKNYDIVDRSGLTIPACRIGDRVLPPFGVATLNNVKNLKIRDSDVMLCGFPKTGCHWVQEILHMLLTGRPELTRHGKVLGGMIDNIPPILVDSLSSPRVLNSHLLFEELPDGVRQKKTKIILTVRNPKDTVVSFYNHMTNMRVAKLYDGTFNDFFYLFMKEKLPYGSYCEFYKSWDRFIKDSLRHPVLLLAFEDNKANPLRQVKRIANFLGLEITDELAENIVAKSNFNHLKRKRQGNVDQDIFRKGQVGDWINWLSEEQSHAIDVEWESRMKECTYQPTYT